MHRDSINIFELAFASGVAKLVLYYAFVCSLALGNIPPNPNGKKHDLAVKKGNGVGEEDKSKKASLGWMHYCSQFK
jgi:hypothetical protein